jgi:hypothetical protein
VIAIAAYELARLTNRQDRRLWTISVGPDSRDCFDRADVAWLIIAAGRAHSDDGEEDVRERWVPVVDPPESW